MDQDNVVRVLEHFGVNYRLNRSGKPWIVTECLLAAFKHADPIDEAKHPGASVEISPDGLSRYVCRSTNCGASKVFLFKTIVRQLLGLLKEPTAEDVEVDRWVHAIEVDDVNARLMRTALRAEKRHQETTFVNVARSKPGVVRKAGKKIEHDEDLMDESALDKFSTELPPYVYETRGLTPETVKDWGLRYDARYGRVVIPLRRADGRLVGYAGRILPHLDVPDADGVYPPKYFNYRGMNKDRYLFGAHRWKDDRPVVLTEGQFDAIKTSQALGSGYNVGATLGSGFSDAHYSTVVAANPPIVFLFQDSDTAGVLAAKAIKPRLKNFRVVRAYPVGKDPGDMTDAAIREAIESASVKGLLGL